MSRLWDALSAVYGADVWLRRYPESSMAQWESALQAFTLADIARGIERCRNDKSGRVPTMGQFTALCRQYSAPAHKPLPSPAKLIAQASKTADSAIARRHIDICRRIQNGERVPKSELLTLPPLTLPGGDRIHAADAVE